MDSNDVHFHGGEQNVRTVSDSITASFRSQLGNCASTGLSGFAVVRVEVQDTDVGRLARTTQQEQAYGS